jgi:glycosyltransferase involved in cell wall biosynthesis
MLLSIIIPVYNEQNTIKVILKKIEKINFIKKEIIIINDGSNDNTYQTIKEECSNLYNECINLDRNYGKGYACRLGLKKANGDIILIQDADLEYDPNDYKKLIEPILRGLSKVVYGSRVLHGATRKRPFSFDVIIRMFANYFLTYLSNLLNKQKLTDAHTCYKVFS